MTSKHTPGPWEYGVRRDKSIWLSIGDPAKGPHRQGDLHASEADAQLIAAAPDLLDAARECLHAELARMLKLKPGAPATTYCAARIERIKAAIAKAEGRS